MHRHTKVINIVGGPGSGKTTLAALLFAELKMQGHTAEYVQEYIKHLVWRNDTDAINNQYLVSTEQYKLFKAVVGKVDFIVTDGALLHGLYYNRNYPDNVSNVEKTELKILQYISEFDNVYVFLERGDFEFEKQGRLHTEEESREIDCQMKRIVDGLGVEYLTTKSAKHNVAKVFEFVMS